MGRGRGHGNGGRGHRGPLRSSQAGDVGVSVRGGRLRVGAVPSVPLLIHLFSWCRIIWLVRSPAYPVLVFSPYLFLSFFSARTVSPHKYSPHPPLFPPGYLGWRGRRHIRNSYIFLFLLILTIMPELTLEGRRARGCYAQHIHLF